MSVNNNDGDVFNIIFDLVLLTFWKMFIWIFLLFLFLYEYHDNNISCSRFKSTKIPSASYWEYANRAHLTAIKMIMMTKKAVTWGQVSCGRFLKLAMVSQSFSEWDLNLQPNVLFGCHFDFSLLYLFHSSFLYFTKLSFFLICDLPTNNNYLHLFWKAF